MSLPRAIVAGVTYLVTRRCTRRYFLFRPDANGTMQRLFWYCLAVAAKEHGVVVHAATLMSDHVHLVITDVEGVLPKFLHDFHRGLAMMTKAHRRWPEEVFNKSQTSVVELCTPRVLAEKMAYTVANPALSWLVRYTEEWPGAMSRLRDIGGAAIRVRRPAVWLDAQNASVDWPEVAELSIAMPAVLVEEWGSVQGARAALAEEVRRLEREAAKEAKAAGRAFLGAERAMKAKISDQARTPERVGGRNPTFAAGGDAVAAAAALARRRAFRSAYRQALMRWQGGEREVVFPAGTWWMRVHHHAKCDPATAPPG